MHSVLEPNYAIIVKLKIMKMQQTRGPFVGHEPLKYLIFYYLILDILRLQM